MYGQFFVRGDRSTAGVTSKFAQEGSDSGRHGIAAVCGSRCHRYQCFVRTIRGKGFSWILLKKRYLNFFMQGCK
jgi:hypothetical protein